MQRGTVTDADMRHSSSKSPRRVEMTDAAIAVPRRLNGYVSSLRFCRPNHVSKQQCYCQLVHIDTTPQTTNALLTLRPPWAIQPGLSKVRNVYLPQLRRHTPWAGRAHLLRPLDYHGRLQTR